MRTTFASADTANFNVKLSCCEHYGNVLYAYNDMELKAVCSAETVVLMLIDSMFNIGYRCCNKEKELPQVRCDFIIQRGWFSMISHVAEKLTYQNA